MGPLGMMRDADQGSLGLSGRAGFLSMLRRVATGTPAATVLARMRALPFATPDALIGAGAPLIVAPLRLHVHARAKTRATHRNLRTNLFRESPNTRCT